jgi:hypothetical protein
LSYCPSRVIVATAAVPAPTRQDDDVRSSEAARRRRNALLTVLGLAATVSFVVGASSGSNGEAESETEEPLPPSAELPGGGHTMFPDRRVVALYGAPQDPQLGALGIGTPDEAGEELEKQAAQYERADRPVLPAMELISTIAAADPGDDGDHNFRQPDRVIDRYLEAARDRDALLILDVQPGYADFMDEVRRLEPYLREPDVGLALDPEWSVEPPEIPGQVIGSVDAETVNEVSAFLDELVTEERLPQKLLVVHQFTDDMIAAREMLEERPNVATVLNSDGFGNIPQKKAKYDELSPQGPTREFDAGFKLFYLEDFPVMTPKQVLDLKPQPDLVVYE